MDLQLMNGKLIIAQKGPTRNLFTRRVTSCKLSWDCALGLISGVSQLAKQHARECRKVGESGRIVNKIKAGERSWAGNSVVAYCRQVTVTVCRANTT